MHPLIPKILGGDMPRTGAAPSLLPLPEQEASFVFLQVQVRHLSTQLLRTDIELTEWTQYASTYLRVRKRHLSPLSLRRQRQSHSIVMILTKEILFRIPSFITTPCGEWGVQLVLSYLL